MTSDSSMDHQMAETVKEMQRRDPVAKEQWYAFCEEYGEDVRDPAKHKASYINSFITQFNAGARLEFSGGKELASWIKIGQGKSKHWREVWKVYCDQSQDPRQHDPAKRDFGHLEGFFDFIGKASANARDCPDEPSMKRMKGPNGMSMGMETGHMMKDQLVSQIKAYQKLGPMQIDSWHTFCDMQLGGIRDPSRHDSATLENFIMTNGISGMTGSMMPDMSRGNSVGSVGGADPELVQKIKNFQKQGQTEKEAWHEYADAHAGGKRDPNRLDNETLQAFISIHGLGW